MAFSYDPFVSAEEVERLGCEVTSLNELLKKSDVVSLHARLSPETEGMFGARQFSLMKESAYFINTARGELVRYDDLYAALKEKRIAGAALDVFEAEPLPMDSPLCHLENVTVTPHIAGATRQSAENGAYMVAEDIYLFMTGRLPRHCANPEVLAIAERRSS
ncbi:D-3-phosphoglycerate dehydrogenase / 2-oxoglutarate reductase [Candidatus Hakubella thermalkaliphila]|uniref:D-3-phosphoglycerate dehydrogenase / 2-oxoglutarate reductase n=2 Tax=Candidatus Hakubella thermalkaliphila TaxID=2754717 RepID=A0A6V8NJD3_9ACTN|nr:NAD(P)-dependent oxidoreductase [Candidatus Hakubella thermalkaliphila]GFP19471.1 D-3-phosphoglycerate dehydrogenase / 2-oxoglutarate reductase [Candidatus Hakubella thermalkaliphila]